MSARKPSAVAASRRPTEVRYPNRIKELAKARGLKQQQIADQMGHDRSTISDFYRGDKQLNQIWQQRFASFFDVPFSEIIEPPSLEGIRRVKIGGYVQAGNWSEAHDTQDFGEIIIPDDAELRKTPLYARMVRGESMNRIYPDRSVIVLSDMQQRPETPLSGKCYHIQIRRADGLVEDTIKRFIRRPNGDEWLQPDTDAPGFADISLDRFDLAKRGEEIKFLGRVRVGLRREE